MLARKQRPLFKLCVWNQPPGATERDNRDPGVGWGRETPASLLRFTLRPNRLVNGKAGWAVSVPKVSPDLLKPQGFGGTACPKCWVHSQPLQRAKLLGCSCLPAPASAGHFVLESRMAQLPPRPAHEWDCVSPAWRGGAPYGLAREGARSRGQSRARRQATRVLCR